MNSFHYPHYPSVYQQHSQSTISNEIYAPPINVNTTTSNISTIQPASSSSSVTPVVTVNINKATQRI
jgi:hypothetical protein